MRKGLAIVVFIALSLLFIACSGEKKVEETAAAPAQETVAEPAQEGAGVLLAKEILGVFDEVVTKMAEMAKDKAEVAVIKPQIEELLNSYRPRMIELNGKYLALRDADIAQFGACNGYLGENRGQSIFKKDTVLSEIVAHYNLQVGDQNMVNLLSTGPIELLDLAVNQTQPVSQETTEQAPQ